ERRQHFPRAQRIAASPPRRTEQQPRLGMAGRSLQDLERLGLGQRRRGGQQPGAVRQSLRHGPSRLGPVWLDEVLRGWQARARPFVTESYQAWLRTAESTDCKAESQTSLRTVPFRAYPAWPVRLS